MEHTIDQVAQVLNDEGACCGDCGREPGEPLLECPDCERFLTGYARALADAGLLSPAPEPRADLADAWDEGYSAGADDMSDLRAGRLTFQTITSNPYQQEATR